VAEASHNKLPAETRIGAVALTVSNLKRSLRFYQNTIGLKVRRQEGNRAVLGVEDAEFLTLIEDPDARPVEYEKGLYHFAIVVPTRLALAQALMYYAQTRTAVQGLSEHYVSESVYLGDPDEHGVEIYRDRPREEWEYPDGELKIGTVTLNTDAILHELDSTRPGWRGLPAGTRMGHIHIHALHVPTSETFYTDVLGFDIVTRFRSFISMLSAGGYHHHIACAMGSGFPSPDALGLQWYTIQLPNAEERDKVIERVRDRGIDIEERPEGLFFRDPSHIGILLTVQ
jgi:catechol 2,3-dioxygenase